VKSDPDTVPGTFDNDLGESCGLKTTSNILTDLQIFVKLSGVVLAFGIPLGAPVFVDCEAKPDWINFLSHDS
jgi:hypothetical protein